MSLFGTLFKFGKSLAVGALTGGPAGAIAAGTSLLLKKRGAVTAADSVITTTDVTPFSYHKRTASYFDGGRPFPTNGGTAGPTGGMPVPQLPTTMAGCPVGFRLNKSTYVTRGGGTSRWPAGLAVHPKGTTCVKRRRRNVGNARALRRAISRVKGFVKLARKAHSLVGGHRQKKLPPGRGQNIEIVRG